LEDLLVLYFWENLLKRKHGLGPLLGNARVIDGDTIKIDERPRYEEGKEVLYP
jgi:hypothetical protein